MERSQRSEETQQLLTELSDLIADGRFQGDEGALVARIRDALSSTSAQERSVLHVRCFGTFAIHTSGRWDPGPSPKRGRHLLEYLVAYPKGTVTRETLAEALWPGFDADAVTHRLHIAVSGARQYLKQVIGDVDAIRCVSGGYAWEPAVVIESDLSRFLSCGHAADLSAVKTAVEIYAGEFLAGENADWVEPLRVRCASQYVAMLERLAEASLTDGDINDALQYGLALLAADRGHEGASRLVMRCFAALGRRGRALAEYEALRAYLRKHLGLEPTPETTFLVRTIMETQTPLGEPASESQNRTL